MLGNSKLTIDMNVSGMIGFLLCPVTDCHRLHCNPVLDKQ